MKDAEEDKVRHEGSRQRQRERRKEKMYSEGEQREVRVWRGSEGEEMRMEVTRVCSKRQTRESKQRILSEAKYRSKQTTMLRLLWVKREAYKCAHTRHLKNLQCAHLRPNIILNGLILVSIQYLHFGTILEQNSIFSF